MSLSEIAVERLDSQHITHSGLKSPEEVIAHMGAIQAQDYAGAKWSVGLRLPGSTDADVEKALAGRSIVRTWAVRGTLHFVAATDIDWLLALVAPHVIKGNSRRYRELGLDFRTLGRSNEVLSDAFSGGKQLERRALRMALEEHDINADGQRFPYMVQRASLEGIICQVGMHRNNPVFARLGEWLPEARISGWGAGAGDLAERYFRSRGPATLQDFVWWSGLPASDARAGLESVKSQFVLETAGGRTYWRSRERTEIPEATPGAYLLPGFDEYLLSYRDRRASLERIGGTIPGPKNGAPVPTMVTRGQVVGTWKRTLGTGSVAVVPNPLVPLNGAEDLAFGDTARRYGDFLGMSVVW